MTTILVTGGCGTLGRAFIEHLAAKKSDEHKVAIEKDAAFWGKHDAIGHRSHIQIDMPTVRVFSRNDSTQAEMGDALGNPPWLRFLIGDVRDLDRLRLAMRGVDMVAHCAALKHVGACERNPAEAMETNARGTANVVQAAIEAGVKRLVLVSTDKAADPTTTLGASKLAAERIIVDSAKWTRTALMVARLGNVWNSRGSFPQRAWAAVSAGRPIQMTDPFAIRYVITAERAGEFVHDVLIGEKTGRIYIPDMEKMTVRDMATRAGIREDAPYNYIGLQPGEKFEEVIVGAHERPVSCPEVRGGAYLERQA